MTVDKSKQGKPWSKGQWRILSFCFLFALWLSPFLVTLATPAQAECLDINEHDHIPLYIRSHQCFELQGGNVLDGQYVVQGKLFIKAGRQVKITPGSTITIYAGGLLESRGQLDIPKKSQINLDDGGSLSIAGLLYLQSQAEINSRGTTSVKNQGRFLLDQDSRLNFTGTTSILNTGIMTLVKAQVLLAQQSKLENVGTIKAEAETTIKLQDQAVLFNKGKLALAGPSILDLSGNTRFTNKRQILPEGLIQASGHAIVENGAPLRAQSTSRLLMSNYSQLLNEHTLEIFGQASFNNNVRILNSGVFAVKKDAKVKTVQQAVMINTGTFRNEGGTFAVESKANFINENIISGRGTRIQDHDRKRSH